METLIRSTKVVSAQPTAPGSDRRFDALVVETFPAGSPKELADADDDIFTTGAFDGQEGGEVVVNVNHQQSMALALGYGKLFPKASREMVPMKAKLFEGHQFADKAWALLNEGLISELSIEYQWSPRDAKRRKDGVREIRKAEITAVSLLDGEEGSQKTAILCTGMSCKSQGCKCPDEEVGLKVGRTISARTEAQIRQIRDLADSVLASVAEEIVEPEGKSKEPPQPPVEPPVQAPEPPVEPPAASAETEEGRKEKEALKAQMDNLDLL